MTRKILSLNDTDWRFASVEQKPFGDVNDLDEARDWQPAQVPGDVRLDLLRAGKIDDPFYAANNEDSRWVDARDWWYTREVEFALKEDERAFLVLEGVDYQSAVFFDGKPLGRHTGMFSRQIHELQSSVVMTVAHFATASQSSDKTSSRHSSPVIAKHPCGTRHTLAIRIWGSDALPKLRRTLGQRIWGRIVKPMFAPPNEPFPDRYATLKCQMQFGWDFAPRLRTCGIWDEATIVIANSVFVRDAFVKCQMTNDKSQIAHVRVSLELDSDREQGVSAQCVVRGKNFAAPAQTFAFDLPLARGVQTHELAFDLRDARLWNPWDRGEPNLYEIEMEVLSPSSSEFLDSMSTTFGIRSFRLARAPGAPARSVTLSHPGPSERNEGSEPWTFVVNGQREFVRGANWVPLDAIPGRLTRSDYAARLKQARDANVNLLRVWGGGLKEKRAFYDLCDELGLLVWQEFPFAGATLDRFPRDRAFLDFTREECSAIVRALRNHPSLVVWCGGNEFNTRGNHAVVETLREVVERADGTRPFKPASPYRDEAHNWGVWHRLANLRDYRDDPTPFLSEFGLQSLPGIESLKKFLPDDALTAPNALWEYHHGELKKLERYAASVVRRGSSDASNQPPSPVTELALSVSKGHPSHLSMTTEDWIDATQRAQAFGLQIAIEHMRRRKGKTAGVAVWQFDDAWPAISWSVIDYYGTPKRAYEELKRLYSPVLASFDYALQPRRRGDVVHGELWLINDLLSSFQNAEASAYLNGEEVFKRRVNLALDSATRVDALDVTLGEGDNVLRLKVNWGPAVMSDHTYDLNFCDIGEVNAIGALLVAVGKRLMR